MGIDNAPADSRNKSNEVHDAYQPDPGDGGCGVGCVSAKRARWDSGVSERKTPMTAKMGLVIAAGVVGAAALVIVGCTGSSSSLSAPAAATGTLRITTLSSKPDLVTGGSALVQVAYPRNAKPANLHVTLNGVDATSSFTAIDATAHTVAGLVTGLTTNVDSATGSANTLVVTDPTDGLAQVSLTLTNFPITGPVLSGPHISPYECRTKENGLGDSRDADCSAMTAVHYFYRGSMECTAPATSCFKPLADPTASRPTDLVNTTTNDGNVVPYIVRVESGTVNRGVYNLAMLDSPDVGAPLPATFIPGAGWNRKLVLSFGCCGAAQFNQGVMANTSALSDTELSRGFAFLNSTEMWNNQHANPHLQGETAMMLKEYFIKHVGLPKWTVGTGGSGGAIQQYLIAQLYPGVLDGIQPSASFPETFMPNVYECRLANNVFKSDPARWTAAKQNAIQGFNTGTCNSWDLSFASALIRLDINSGFGGCGVTDPVNVAKVYNATANPTGTVFCNLFATNTNLLGKDASGRARRPVDNVGVQYGLGALNRGDITIGEFLDFNQVVGGFDRDGYGPVIPAAVLPGAPAARQVADVEAVRLAYAGGFKNSFSGPGLANIPIITQRSNASLTGDIHDTLQDLIIRARLQRANGRTDNQVIFTSSAQSTAAGFQLAATSIDTINVWLDAMAADPAPASIDKVVRNKPALATDACWDKAGVRIAETASTDPAAACNKIYPRFSTLRIEAGETLVQDGVKCSLKPVRPADYKATFTNAQWVRLKEIFPLGVCDWSKPGVNQVPLQGTYLRLPLS